MQVPSLGWEDLLEKEWWPTPVFLLVKSHGQRRLASYSRGSCKRVGHHFANKHHQQDHTCLSSKPLLFPQHAQDAGRHLASHLRYWDFKCLEKMTAAYELSLSPRATRMLICGGTGFSLWMITLHLTGGDCNASDVNDFWGDAEASEDAWQSSWQESNESRSTTWASERGVLGRMEERSKWETSATGKNISEALNGV